MTCRERTNHEMKIMRQALASVGEWEALRKFGAERKSPIGYKPFALACMRNIKSGLLQDDAERYIDSYIERVRASCNFFFGGQEVVKPRT